MLRGRGPRQRARGSEQREKVTEKVRLAQEESLLRPILLPSIVAAGESCDKSRQHISGASKSKYS